MLTVTRYNVTLLSRLSHTVRYHLTLFYRLPHTVHSLCHMSLVFHRDEGIALISVPIVPKLPVKLVLTSTNIHFQDRTITTTFCPPTCPPRIWVYVLYQYDFWPAVHHTMADHAIPILNAFERCFTAM
jgi:hypothetical protein